MQIRPATTTDRTAILALMRPRDYNRIHLQPICFLIAEEDARVVGIGQIKRHWDGTPELASLVVDETKRGQGIGRALVRALVAHHFAQHPAEVLYLFCLSTLEHYYQPFGFQRAVRQELPWPLAVMHLAGNGIGQIADIIGHGFQVIAMKIAASK
ncbi:MAG: GNAT family N-acetyltransferase [Caldilineaceae bacterium]